MKNVYATFFNILASIVNNTSVDWNLFTLKSNKEWELFYNISSRQGVVGVVFEKLKDIPKELAPPKAYILRWLSHTMSIEKQMRAKEIVAIEFADKLSERDIHTVVLKGLVFASYYPNPYHRESGDLDCFLMGKKECGDKVVVEIGGSMEEAGYKHSHLYYKGLTIENHKYITSFDNTKLGIRTERILQNLIKVGQKPICNTKLLRPSADFNALFLIKHAQRHFIKEGISVRQLLDWAFFLKAEGSRVNWNKIAPIMKECRVMNFAQVLTSLCVEKFGLSVNIDELKGSSVLSEAVLDDILCEHPSLSNEKILRKVGRIFRRFYRMWKFRFLADESYVQLVWNNLAFSSYLKRKPQL